MTQDQANAKGLDISLQVRNFEIGLFWTRSLFFWGFIGSAFGGYAALRLRHPSLALAVACFGMVCSFAWTLLNRGSKYWQENWETKVVDLEMPVVGALFATTEPVQAHKGPWLRARMFSPSKLTIALSDYVFIMWLGIVLGEILRAVLPPGAWRCTSVIGIVLFVIMSFCYLALLLVFGRRSIRACPTHRERH